MTRGRRSPLASRTTSVGIGVIAALAWALVACGNPGASVDFSGACVADGRAPGAYPELERAVPLRSHATPAGALEPIPPTTLDSGRNCTDRALGTLRSHGVTEVRYAGATWDDGGGNAIVRALLTSPSGPLEATWVEEFYEAGARAGRKTDNIETSRPNLGQESPVYRLDTLNDLSFQTVVVWPDPSGVQVVIVTTTVTPGASRAEHDRRVADAVAGR